MSPAKIGRLKGGPAGSGAASVPAIVYGVAAGTHRIGTGGRDMKKTEQSTLVFNTERCDGLEICTS